MLSMPVLRLALPIFANLRALKITAIINRFSRMAAGAQHLLDNEEWAAVQKSVKRLVLFDFRMTIFTRYGIEPSTVLRRIQKVGPPIRQWTVTGEVDLSSLIPGTCQNLEFLGIHPAGMKILRFLNETFSTEDGDISDLVTSFPSIEELDLANQTSLTDAALLPLAHHRPLKVLGISSTAFTASAVTALLTARGSLLEHFDIRGIRWPFTKIFRSIGVYTPKLSVLIFDNCPNLHSTHFNIHRLKPALLALRLFSPLPVDSGKLPDSVCAVSFDLATS
ncbi:hypothetical protein BDK51DRAFT_39658 [Blyttiomyces helicus]|uniref:F-box domain-containing protein n=1 Tax=Blyttiomyces helicus TaxID=388810 RepID=A0A4P9W8F1_9FUNG|nr:hypothetical protein BDK51DRAFT_39658 [Blyttiomyces helicus]|eukprot:RKO88624.1 hypothetical protein BDK51DRAFT_39658 [Blyttiomyces helicus]